MSYSHFSSDLWIESVIKQVTVKNKGLASNSLLVLLTHEVRLIWDLVIYLFVIYHWTRLCAAASKKTDLVFASYMCIPGQNLILHLLI